MPQKQNQERIGDDELLSILESDDKHLEVGIRFELSSPERLEEIWEFLSEEFLPDEPVMRSMGMNKTATAFQRYMRNMYKQDVVAKKCLESQAAYGIVARNASNKIMGVKLGFTVSAGDKEHEFSHLPWLRHLYWALPKSVEETNTIMWFFERKFRYHPSYALEDLKVRRMFVGEILAVSKKARGLGLGKEMLRKSMEVAKAANCEAYFSGLSSIYSQKIYKDLGFTVFREMSYKDVKSKSGKPLLNDTGEHTKVQNASFHF